MFGSFGKQEVGNKTSENVIWTTAKVDSVLQRMQNGERIVGHHSPFWENKIDWRKDNIIFQYSEDEIEEMVKCSIDIKYFANTYCHVMMEDMIRQVTLRDYQEDILDVFCQERFIVFLASRQIGKTISTAIYIVWFLCFNRDKNAIIIANKGETASDILEKMKTIIKNLPFYMRPGILVNNKMHMSFDNGCTLSAHTTTKSASIGNSCHLLYVDEFAHIDNTIVQQLYKSVYPTLSSFETSQMIITSTANGLNMFYEIYSNAKNVQSDINKRSDFYALRVDWWQVPGRDENWKLRQIRNLGSEELFNSEYGNQFLSASVLLLSGETLKRLSSNKNEYIHIQLDEFDNYYEEDVDYSGLLWNPKYADLSFDKTDRFVLTVDTSDGLGDDGDYSVINIFKVVMKSIEEIDKMNIYSSTNDFFRFEQIAIFHSNEHDIQKLAPVLKILSYDIFGVENCRVVIEMNWKGDWLCNLLMEHKDYHDNLIFHMKRNPSDILEKMGVKIRGSEVKNLYCKMLRTNLTNGIISITESKTISELSNFMKNKKGSFSCETGHDDLAMSCVLLSPFIGSEWHEDLIYDMCDSMNSEIVDLINKKLDLRYEEDNKSAIDELNMIQRVNNSSNVNHEEMNPKILFPPD